MFHENILDAITLRYSAYTIFIGKKSKAISPYKNVSGVPVLVLCTSSDDGLY